ncbi:ABC transporter permease [Yinghuangia seranimata]|uniref:ABC transporter permease n=1 Tax=Yinghuangia seranimata TaxID=408067 RepID=UPI00248CC369|nr:ABC transporter permease [Yinghuangia seranimata]MDI2124737.1 ABC transporter permease [Yinghuangia seranimata]
MPAERRPGLGRGAWPPLVFLGVLCTAALLAPVLPLADPTHSDTDALAAGISAKHWLGTDALGRDTLSRIVHGARVSLVVGVGATAIGAVAGTLLGMAAGVVRGWVSAVIMRLTDVLLAFPAMIFALAVIGAVGPSTASVTVVIGLLFIPGFVRIVRAPVLSLSQREFVLACRAMGMSTPRLMAREILPNILTGVLTYAVTMFGVGVMVEGGLGFLGVSVPPPEPTWGGMIAEGRQVLAQHPMVTLTPTLVLVLVVVCANVVGDRLSARLDTRGAML